MLKIFNKSKKNNKPVVSKKLFSSRMYTNSILVSIDKQLNENNKLLTDLGIKIRSLQNFKESDYLILKSQNDKQVPKEVLEKVGKNIDMNKKKA